MGVVYKLRQDIIDFIVQTKMADPSLSCRKLVGVIKAQFGVDVSKSSVNGVIKEFQLSGPIGRYPRFKAPKYFAIPKDKKTTLLNNVQPFLSEVSDPIQLLSTEVSSEEMSSQDIVIERSVQEAVETESLVVPQELVEPLTLRADLLQWSEPVQGDPDLAGAVFENMAREQAREASNAPLSVWLGDLGMSYGRLGAAALWFTFKSVCIRGCLGDLIARTLGSLPGGVTSQDCEVLFFTDLFGEHRPGFESNDLRTLWRLSGLDDSQGRALMEKAESLDSNKTLCTTIATELAIAFTPVRYFRLLTEKGERFYVDAYSMTLHHEFIDAGQVSAQLPIFMGIERAVDRLMTNIEPFISEVTSAGLTPQLVRFVQLMGGFGEDSLISVEVIGDNDIKCAEFSSVPLMRRDFILRVRLNQHEMSRIDYEMIENTKKFGHEFLGCEGNYSEGELILEAGIDPLRVLTVKTVAGEEFVLLSNISKGDASGGLIVETFVKNYSALSVGYTNEECSKRASIEPPLTSFRHVFRFIDTQMRKFFCEPLGDGLSWQEMCSILYDLPGIIKEHPKALLFRLQLPQDPAWHGRLGAFLSKLNKAGFRTIDGRSILFFSEPLTVAL